MTLFCVNLFQDKTLFTGFTVFTVVTVMLFGELFCGTDPS